MNIHLIYHEGSSWYSEGNIHVKGRVFNSSGQLLYGKSLWNWFADVTEEADFLCKIRELNGAFSVVMEDKTNGIVRVAVDRLRNFPLLYTQEGHTFLISDSIDKLSQVSRKTTMDPEAENCLRSFGYTLGRSTLIKDIYQLRGGEYLLFDGTKYKTGFYREIPTLQFEGEYKAELKKLFLKLGKRICTALEGRPVALPLSGGWDSRIIALLLKLNGYKDVFCFTYGNPDQSEAYRSEKIAGKLGYSWHIIDYHPFLKENYLHTESFRKYVDWVGNGISFPYLQEYFAARYLKEEMKLSSRTIFLPGHSGDALGGSHFFPDMEHSSSLMDYAHKNYRRNGRLLLHSSKDKQAVLQCMVNHISPERKVLTHLLHDYWLTEERQTKQIVNSAKVWNYFGYEYMLPLWDEELTTCCLSLPFECRLYKKVYNEVLEELFLENDLLLENESAAIYTARQKKAFFRQRIKTYIGFFLRFFPKKDRYDFFYFEELLEPIRQELPPIPANELNAWLSAWYAFYFKNKLENL